MGSEPVKGYVKKPWWMYAGALGFLTIPIATLIHFGLEFGFSNRLMWHVVRTDYFVLETVAALSGAVAVFIASRASFLYFVMLCFCTAGLRIWEYKTDSLLGTPLDAAMSAFWIVLGLVFVRSALRAPYLNPKIRWWAQPERVRFVSNCALEYNGVWYPVVTINISAGGAFVKLDERLLSSLNQDSHWEGDVIPDRRKADPSGNVLVSAEQLAEAQERIDDYPNQLGERVRLRVQMLPDAANVAMGPTYESQAEVMWAASPESDYRYGLGVRFTGQKWGERRDLNRYLELLERLGFETRTRQVLGEGS